MLMKEARLFCVVALDAAVLLSAAHSLCYYTALAMASLRTVLSPMQKRMFSLALQGWGLPRQRKRRGSRFLLLLLVSYS